MTVDEFKKLLDELPPAAGRLPIVFAPLRWETPSEFTAINYIPDDGGLVARGPCVVVRMVDDMENGQ